MSTIKLLKVKDVKDLVKAIFWRKEFLVDCAVKILEKIRKGELDSHSLEKVKEELGLTTNQYYYILSQFRKAGIVQRVDGKWVLSRRFLTLLDTMISTYEEIYRRSKV